mgnify:CR=1 FL=1
MKYETNFTWTMFSILNSASGQEIPLPEKMPQTHPRVLTTPAGKQETWKLIKKEEWAKDVFNKLKERTEVYTNLTDAQPAWVLSRLAMYWKSHATEVYVKGETFDHAGGERAPYPTVRYTGTRGTAATVPNWRMSFLMMMRMGMSLSAIMHVPAVLWRVYTHPKQAGILKA